MNASRSNALLLAFSLILTGLPATPALAQAEVSIGGVKMEEEAGVPGVMGDVDDTLEISDEEEAPGDSAEKARGWEPVVAPLPSRNSTFGWMLSVPAMLMYRPSFSEPDDRVWISGLFGFYAENESWGAGLLQRMSFGGDQWRVMGSLFHAEMNYKYYGIGAGGEDRFIVLDQDVDLFMAEGLRRIAPSFFIGLKGVFAETSIGPRLPDETLPPGIDPDALKIDLTMATIAPRLQYDTRDAEFYPTSGLFIDATAAVSRESFGADLDYERYQVDANHYVKLGEKGVLASRLASRYVSSNAPFFLFPAFGQGVDLRGYQMGSYRDQFLVAAQTEYRHRFTERIGAVAFVGLGSVSPDFLGWEKTLGSVGAGFRWVIAPKNNISLRLDIARGRDETIYYVGVGEAF
jgi:hypothetical protein